MTRDGDELGERVDQEPWGPRLWLAILIVAAVTALLCSFGISRWPMVDDEVPSLVEMGLLEVEPQAFSVPARQIWLLPKAMPVWYGFQRAALAVLPSTEWGYRFPSLVCAVLTSAIVFAAAARWRGLWFAAALSMVLLGSQMFVLLAQVNRFYSMPLLLLTVTMLMALSGGRERFRLPATCALAALTVLSHNLIVAVFGLAALAAGGAWLLGRAPWSLVLRTGSAAAVGAVLYVSFMRPLIHGWGSTGNPTPVLVSFAAHTGVSVVALALFGAWLAIRKGTASAGFAWWAVLLLSTPAFLLFAPVSWNPRYFFFFMPACWVLAAFSIETIGRGFRDRATRAAWYGVVLALMLPSLLSHLRDGSRHDYREAAAVLARHASPGQPILSDDAETISYYLASPLKTALRVRTKVTTPPEGEFFLVTRSNAWLPLPQVPGRAMDVLAEISRRRYDQFSHILRVYRVHAVESAGPGPKSSHP